MVMAKWIVRTQKVGEGIRVTIPAYLTRKLDWRDINLAMIEDQEDGTVIIRKFLTNRDLERAPCTNLRKT